ncbi:MAG TPA: endonuclease/exonuclease/phosphatase family protein, partial [Spirochaetia bacterium]|nr:endonuclease/exonuclease/phosphatase family protein [Spirochaetia bacterium]
MRSVGLSLLFLLSLSVLFLSCRPELTIMSYNVDNLFDDVDSGTEYEEYDPGGGRWTNEDFTDKLKAVAEVIKRAHPRGPDIVALQEVENRLCLDRLCDDHLSNLDYRYRVLVPARDQAVHCAFISRYPITRVGALNPGYWEGRAQRMIVEAVIEVEGHSFHVFNNHWKSKIGGSRATEPARLASSRLLAERIGEILAEEPQADIVVLGDFNENVGEYEEYG